MTSDKKYTYWLLIILLVGLVFLSPRIPDKIPDPILKLFLNPYFRAFVVFISIYLIQFNMYLSIIITLIFLILLNKVENSFLFELFLDHYQKKEAFSDRYVSEEEHQERNEQKFNNHPEKARQCLNLVGSKFPCNNKNDGKCCENINYDILAKDIKGNTDNITLFMNKEIEKQNLRGIENINEWCHNYLKEGEETIDFNCKNKFIRDNCKKIMKTCNPNNWGTSIQRLEDDKRLDFSGTCGAIDENIHGQVCFDLDPKKNKCKSYNKNQCIANKKDCFYIENNQFMNSKIKKNNAIYRCKIPQKKDDIPKNCFPVKLYKDTCGNVGMGCWVKEEDIEAPQDKPVKIPTQHKIFFRKKKKETPIFQDHPSISYNPGNSMGSITNTHCA